VKVARDKECKILNETNVHWADKIPYGWQVLRIQDFATVNDDLIKERKFRNQQIKYVDISGVNAYENTYLYEIQRFDDAPSRARRLVKSGDTVFSTVRPYLKAIATVVNPEKSLIFSTGFAVIRPGEGTDYRFIGYLLRDEMFVNRVAANSVGASYPAINASDLIKLHVLIPPLPEQRAIANFLDEKCARIDEAVRIKERQIELLRERRQILIQKAVTRGLNPDAPMKDSGVDWIGQIPAHWELRRFKFLCSICTGARNTEDRVDNATYPFFVRSQSVERIDTYSFDGEAILTAGDGAGVGKVFHYINGKFDFHQRVYKFSDFKEVLGKYLFLYLRNNFANVALLGTAKSTVDSLRLPLIQDFEVVFPLDIQEQQKIIETAYSEDEKIADVISTKQSQITALQEYKTVLINAAVTGRIRVGGEQLAASGRL